MIEVLSPDEANRLHQLAASPYRPREIVALKEWIEGEKRALEVRASVMGPMEREVCRRAQVVVWKMRELDGLYDAWAKGKIS